jgi:hypothetical protein
MKIEHHIRKARKFESTIGKLDFHEDYETIIEDYMLAASHLINAALHKLGKLKIEKDVKHNQLFGFLTNELIPEIKSVPEMINNLEQLRPSHVYGKDENGTTAKKAQEYYQNIKSIVIIILGDSNERES